MSISDTIARVYSTQALLVRREKYKANVKC